MKEKVRAVVGLVCCLALLLPSPCLAASTGHYPPAVFGTREYFVPPPGFYASLYTAYYAADKFKDANGNSVDSIPIVTRSGPATVDVSVAVDMVMFSPLFSYVTPWKPLGARYGVGLGPSFANASVSSALSSKTSGQGTSSSSSQFAFGDLFVSPVLLGWEDKYWAASASYGFYAPVGKYNVRTRTLPGGAQLSGTAPDNVGLGFWTHQFQQAAAWYPMGNPGTIVSLAVAEEIHGKKKDFDLTPGTHISFNWGLSQYLPLRGQELLLDIGPAGYSQWQVSDDTGADANSTTRSQVHAAGVQVGVTYVPWTLVVSSRYLNEFSARSRITGQWVTLSVAKKIL